MTFEDTEIEADANAGGERGVTMSGERRFYRRPLISYD
jgi:hypothetical protein